MLTTLSIKNFTIVNELNIDFERGMTAFTGETGAGKSIMIDALSLLLGERAEISFIRDGANGCDLTASFNVEKNPEALVWLKENDIHDGAELILRRTLNQKGRSKAFINGALFPLQKVRQLGDLLLHIHGQNEQYHLLKHDVHREQLDAFANNSKLLANVRAAHKNLQAIELKIKNIEMLTGNDDQKALLIYQLEELDSLQLLDGEVASLDKEHKMLSQANSLISNTEQIILVLESDVNDDALLNSINKLQQMTTQLEYNNNHLNNFKELISNAQIQLEEASSEINQFQQELVLNPERLHDVEQRLELIFDLARKHKVRSEDLYAHQQELKAQLAVFTDHEQMLLELHNAKQQQTLLYKDQAQLLTKQRLKESKLLAKKICQLIKDLGMANAQMEIKISPLEKPTPFGMDLIEYMVSLNPGSEPKALAKIASGGELSRLSLAIQVLTAERKAYPTLMFDEVDTGIGGQTAAKVGQLLRRLGQHSQVFCVTHQAQVASNANWHMKVEKNTKDKQTFSQITPLIGEEKITELARMISGAEMTEQTLAHARSLLEQVAELPH